MSDEPGPGYERDPTPPVITPVLETSDGFLILTSGGDFIAVSDSTNVFTPDVTKPFPP